MTMTGYPRIGDSNIHAEQYWGSAYFILKSWIKNPDIAYEIYQGRNRRPRIK